MFKLPPLPRNLSAALRDLDAHKPGVRVSAVRDLARLAAGGTRPEAVRALARALRDSAHEVRAEAAVGLADAGARELVPAIVTAANDAHPRVRQMALVALAELAAPGDGAALAVVEGALDDVAPALRFQALVAFGRLAGDRAETGLAARLDDEDAEVRYIALRLLEEHWFETASEGPLAPVELAAVRPLVDDVSTKVALAAAILLARAGDRSGTGTLVAAVNERRLLGEPEDLQAAIELCGELCLRDARPGLRRRAWGWFGLLRDPFAFQARVALARMGDEDAVGGILRDLEARGRHVRTLAVVAAGLARVGAARPALQAMRGRACGVDPDVVQQALAELDASGAAGRARVVVSGASDE